MFKSLLLKGRTLCLLLCCMISSLVVTAQTKHSGKVIGGDDKQPLVGAAVRIKGTNLGTVTDVNGEFALATSPGQTLVVSYLTYQTLEVSVTNDQYLTITLQPANNSLNEVVVTGYAVQKKKDLVGAVAVVDVAAANRQPTGSVENQLQGQAAGVTVITSGQPGEAPQVKIRGSNTFGNNTPLYVVDGVPTTNITDLNPNDVANMQVLKDAGSASIYGARAANGVIIITTKKGSGKVNISYDGYYGSQVPKGGNVWDILTPQEMVTLQHTAITNTAKKNGTIPNYSSNLYGPNDDTLPDYINPAGAHEGDASVNPKLYNVNPFYPQGTDVTSFYRITRANKQGTDWYHEIYKTAPMTSQNVALSGSTDQASYLFSLNYFDQRGTLIETYDKRYTIRANTSFNVSKHFRVGENLAYSATQNPTKQSENNEGSVIGFGFREQPIIPVYDIAGNYAGSYTAGLGNGSNPVANARRTHDNFGVDTRVFGNVFAEADFAKYFTIRTQFGGEYYAGYYHSFTYPQYENSENNVTNQYYEQSDNGYNYTWTNTLRYAQVIGKHNIQFLVGTEAYATRNQFLSAQNTDYFSFDPNYVNLSTGSGTPVANSSLEKDKLFSYIGRLDYTFNDRYLLNATIRRDGSSRFLNNQTGWFPAASLGWRVSQEDFMKGVSWINDLKIRGGYGVMGNQINVTPSNAFTTYGAQKTTSYYDINGTSNSTVQGFQKTQIGNPDAEWEKDKNLNVGFDGTFFNQRLEITADYYKKDITGLLYNPALPGTAGSATVPYSNVGAMTNHGFDISVGTHGNFSSDLKYNASLNVTTYHNTIKAISLGSNYFETDGGRFSTGIVRNQVGQPLSSFFGYKVDGFWDSQAEIDAANAAAAAKYGTGTTYQDGVAVGRFKYADVNGDGVIDSRDRTFIGNPNPKFTAGFNFDLTYKQWDFNMFWYWNYGNQIWNDIKWWTDFYPDFGGAKSKTALYDSWTPTHMNASAPIAETESSPATSTVPNSYFVQPGSFLRLKNTQLGYTFAPNILKTLGMSKLRVYVSGANLITITKYKGPDPEITGSTVDFGVDRGNYSPVRTYLIGAQVKF